MRVWAVVIDWGYEGHSEPESIHASFKAAKKAAKKVAKSRISKHDLLIWDKESRIYRVSRNTDIRILEYEVKE